MGEPGLIFGLALPHRHLLRARGRGEKDEHKSGGGKKAANHR
jgi:hypothetical protein